MPNFYSESLLKLDVDTDVDEKRQYLNPLELPDVPSWEGTVPETLDDVLDIACDVPQERSSDFLDFLREYATNRR